VQQPFFEMLVLVVDYFFGQNGANILIDNNFLIILYLLDFLREQQQPAVFAFSRIARACPSWAVNGFLL
jgi:hypothetical protein